MAIEGDKENNDGNVCLEVIPKCSLKIINCEMVWCESSANAPMQAVDTHKYIETKLGTTAA